jgi:hypothetical protein
MLRKIRIRNCFKICYWIRILNLKLNRAYLIYFLLTLQSKYQHLDPELFFVKRMLFSNFKIKGKVIQIFYKEIGFVLDHLIKDKTSDPDPEHQKKIHIFR